MGWALVLALVITILSSGLGLTVQAEEGQEEQQQQEQRQEQRQEPQEQAAEISVFYHDVVNGEVLGAFTTGWPMVARGKTLRLQYQLTEMSADYKDTGNTISGLEVKLVDADDADNASKIFASQTTDGNGMVTFEVTEDQIKAICHRYDSVHYGQALPETYNYGYLATDDGGYNQKLIAYNICLKHAGATIGSKTYKAGINRAPLACFTFKDTKVCKLELTPMTLDYGDTFYPLDLITKVSTDLQGVISEVDVKQPGTAAKTVFTYQNEDGEIVDTIDTTKPGVYTVTVQVFPFGNDEKNKWCWDTQTTTVTVYPIPYIKCPPMCPPMGQTTVVQSINPIPPVAQTTAVTPLKLPATGSVDAGLTIWLSLGLALAGLWLKKRN